MSAEQRALFPVELVESPALAAHIGKTVLVTNHVPSLRLSQPQLDPSLPGLPIERHTETFTGVARDIRPGYAQFSDVRYGTRHYGEVILGLYAEFDVESLQFDPDNQLAFELAHDEPLFEL